MNHINKSLQKKWENILENEGLGDIDGDFGSFYTNSKVNSILTKLKNTDVETLVSEIEKKFNIEVKIDYDTGSILLYEENNLLGSVYPTSLNVDGIEINKHLYLKISKNFRGKGLGKYLLSLYSKLSDLYGEFEMFDKEFTNLPSHIKLYQIFGYFPSQKILNGEFVELSDEDYKLINEGLDGLKDGEDWGLPYTLALRRN